LAATTTSGFRFGGFGAGLSVTVAAVSSTPIPGCSIGAVILSHVPGGAEAAALKTASWTTILNVIVFAPASAETNSARVM
jgi:hypothetical protein